MNRGEDFSIKLLIGADSDIFMDADKAAEFINNKGLLAFAKFLEKYNDDYFNLRVAAESVEIEDEEDEED